MTRPVERLMTRTSTTTGVKVVGGLDVSAMGSACAREDWEDARVAILGDVHGNAHALREAMRGIERAGITKVVFHGDLLTYGCTPRACIALLDELVLRFDAVLLAGNHEPFYFEGQQGAFGVFERKKPFLVESIHWTLKRIEDVTLASRYRWHDVCVFDDVLVSHANPFDRPNWRYLNTARDDAEAAEALAKRGARIGVFGHTHRARLSGVREGDAELQPLSRAVPLRDDARWVLNTGSIGQPRGQGSSWVELDLRGRAEASHRPAEVRVHTVPYDVDAHVAALESSGMSEETIARLVRFFIA